MDYKPVMEYVKKDSICVQLLGGQRQCLVFDDRSVYVLPFFDTLHDYVYLGTSNDTFNTLEVNFSETYKQVKRSYGKPLPLDVFDDTPLNNSVNTNSADIVVSFTSYIVIGGHNYCIIQIEEGNDRVWLIKLKVLKGIVIASQVLLLTT